MPKFEEIPAALCSPDGLNIAKRSTLYTEAHTRALASTLQDCVKNSIHCKMTGKLNWSTKAKNSNTKFCNDVYDRTLAACRGNVSKWNSVITAIRKELSSNNPRYWREYVLRLVEQGQFLARLALQESNLTWRSIIYSLPKKVLSFAICASIDSLPTFKTSQNGECDWTQSVLFAATTNPHTYAK